MADFTWNFNRSPLPLGLKGEMFELNENSDFADVVKYFNDDFDKANAWWIEHRQKTITAYADNSNSLTMLVILVQL